MGLLRVEDLDNLLIGDIAHLVILLLHQALLIAHAALVLWHEGVARRVRLADVAIDPRPAVIALARFAVRPPLLPALLVDQGSAEGNGAVHAAEARRTRALAAGLGAVGELLAGELLQIAVEARRAVVRPVLEECHLARDDLGDI